MAQSFAVDIFELERTVVIPEQAFWGELRDDCKQSRHQKCYKSQIQI